MILSDMGDVFTWVLSKIGVQNLLHYLEIFLLLGSTNYYEGAQVYSYYSPYDNIRDLQIATFWRALNPLSLGFFWKKNQNFQSLTQQWLTKTEGMLS